MSHIVRKLCDNCGKEVSEKDSYHSIELSTMRLNAKWVNTGSCFAIPPDYCKQCFTDMLITAYKDLGSIINNGLYKKTDPFLPETVESKA